LLLCVLTGLAGFTLVGVQWFSDSVQTIFSGKVSASTYQTQDLAVASLTSNNQVFVKITSEIDATAALSVEVINDVPSTLFAKNSQKRLPVASLTKFMTALLILERENMNEDVVISQHAMAEAGEQGSLKLGETLSVRNLLYIMLIESSNRASYALAEVVGVGQFVEAMNTRAEELGMVNTRFADASGLSSNSYSTAEDLAILSKYLFEHFPLFREIISIKEYNLYTHGTFHHKLVNTNKLLDMDGIVGGKTGWTDEAKGCFLAIERDGFSRNYFIHIILGANDRFLEMEKLIRLTSRLSRGEARPI